MCQDCDIMILWLVMVIYKLIWMFLYISWWSWLYIVESTTQGFSILTHYIGVGKTLH